MYSKVLALTMLTIIIPCALFSSDCSRLSNAAELSHDELYKKEILWRESMKCYRSKGDVENYEYSLCRLGHAFYKAGLVDSALSIWRREFTTAKAKMFADGYYSDLMYDRGEYDSSIRILHRINLQCQANEDTISIVSTYSRIANIFEVSGNLDLAISNNLKALYYTKNISKVDSFWISQAKISLMSNLSSLYMRVNKEDSSIFYISRISSINPMEEDTRLTVDRKWLSLYSFNRDTINANKYAYKLMDFLESVNKENSINIYYSLCEYYSSFGDVLATDSMFKMLNNRTYRITACQSIYENLKESGNHVDAIRYNDLYNSIKDSISNENNSLQLRYLDKKFQYSSLKSDKEKAENANLFYKMIAITFILSTILAMFSIQYVKLKSKIRIAKNKEKIRIAKKESKKLKKLHRDINEALKG